MTFVEVQSHGIMLGQLIFGIIVLALCLFSIKDAKSEK